MKENCIIDSSILVRIILSKDEELFLKLNNNFNIYIPVNTLEETSFIIIRESIKEVFKEDRFYEMKRIFEKEEKLNIIFKRIKALNYLAKI